MMRSDAVGATILLPFLIVSVIWGSTWIVIHDQLHDVPAQWSVCFRFLVAALGMAIFARLRRVSLRLDPPAWRFATLLGITQFTFNFNFVYAAETYITSGLVALVYALLMVPNSLLSRYFFGQPITRRFVGGSLIAIAGVACLFVQEWRVSGLADQHMVLVGFSFALAGVSAASIANVMQAAPTAKRVPMEALLAAAMLIGAIMDGIFAFALHGWPNWPTRPGYWIGTLYLGILGSVVTFPLYFRLIQRIGAGPAAYTGVLIPVIAMALSTVIEGYRWSMLAAVGAGLSLVGLILALQSRKPST